LSEPHLPFSNDKKEGFENKIAEIVGSDLGVYIETPAFLPDDPGLDREASSHGNRADQI